MRKLTYLLLAAGIYGNTAMAQTYMPLPANMAATQVSPMDTAIADLQQEWAIIKYQTPDKENQKQAIATLADKAESTVAEFPGTAEPLIWQGIILATKAGINGGLGALSDAKAARRSHKAGARYDRSRRRP